MDVVWNLVAAAAVLVVVVFGFPFLLRGGGSRGRGGRYGRRGRGGFKVRVGPHPALVLGGGLLRYFDTVLLVGASVVFVAAVVLNARAG